MQRLVRHKLWVRCGDQDDYHKYTRLTSAVRYLHSMGASAPFERCIQYGVSSPQFRFQNYISLFWGDKDAQPVAEITEAELVELNRLLKY